jgi:hypothetical protein
MESDVDADDGMGELRHRRARCWRDSADAEPAQINF